MEISEDFEDHFPDFHPQNLDVAVQSDMEPLKVRLEWLEWLEHYFSIWVVLGFSACMLDFHGFSKLGSGS